MNIITKENIRNTVDSSISVVYHKFQSYCKEDNKAKLFCFFEGKDAPYYSPRIKNYFDNYINFKCNNKNNVIKLYKKIKNKKSDYLLAFFVDRDFDNSLENPEIYETPTYSIENLYCNNETIINILKNEYLINNEDEEFTTILNLYETNITDYLNKILLFNSWYHSLKKKKKLLGLDSTNVSLDDKLPNKFLKLEISNIECTYTINCIRSHYNKAIEVTDEEIQTSMNELSQTILLEKLRGKYLITFLIKFIEYLTLDSKSSKNILKENINFTTNKTIILSHLSNYASTPNCLNNYLQSFIKISA
ncbi:DUF4435 domain-containing protein [Flavobacterium sp.]|uniref:DUF4435 domain-containing protein n=1 Tax=Flavobacterium sp. TaxID=239 RepID=UPI0022C84D8E|nr:DUF4435 domain-containing protein [Flavobacterium sp.]MCZ8090903.1 DUF4435 domain-containing protein [Flavobacterium sp.]